MFRFISSITLFLSLLIASNTISEPLNRVSGFNKTDAVKTKDALSSSAKNKLSKAERNQKLEVVKDKSSSFVQDFDSFMFVCVTCVAILWFFLINATKFHLLCLRNI